MKNYHYICQNNFYIIINTGIKNVYKAKGLMGNKKITFYTKQDKVLKAK
jgi:hypothetical protein